MTFFASLRPSDLVLICSHEAYIEDVSNVDKPLSGPAHADFSDREATYNLDDDDPDFDWCDDGDHTGFFVWDFTLEELLTLRRQQGRKDRTGAQYLL